MYFHLLLLKFLRKQWKFLQAKRMLGISIFLTFIVSCILVFLLNNFFLAVPWMLSEPSLSLFWRVCEILAIDWPYRREEETERMEKTVLKKNFVRGRSLIDLVFSWSINDILNEDLYKKQVCTPWSSHPPPHCKKLNCNTCKL